MREDIFRAIHDHHRWGDAQNVSGSGSTLEATANVRRYLARLFEQLDVKLMVDAACGDFQWMKELRPILPDYIGGDIVDSLILRNNEMFGSDHIRFKKMDVVQDPLPPADLVLARDLFVHLREEEIVRAIRNIKASGVKWLLVTTFPDWNRPRTTMQTGQWMPTNLEIWHYGLGEPVHIFNEGMAPPWQHKSLGLWQLKLVNAQKK